MARAKTLIVGITGPMTSGKGAVRYFFIDKGFKSIRHTKPLLDEAAKRKVDVKDKEKWINLATELRKEKGLDVLAKLSEEQIEEDERYVVCPLRHPADIKYLKEKYDAIIIYVDAPFDTRYKRTLMKEFDAGLTEEDFKRRDDEENSPTGPDAKYKININECKNLADEYIMNDGPINELYKKLEDIMRKYSIPEMQDTGQYEDFDM